MIFFITTRATYCPDDGSPRSRELNRSLGRATMNLGWKNRFLESRDAVIVQFRELAAILEEFSNQMEQAADVTASWEEVLSGILRRSHLRVDNMLVLQYENQQKEAFLTLRSVNGRCMTARDVAELLGRAIAGIHHPSGCGVIRYPVFWLDGRVSPKPPKSCSVE